MRPWRHYSYLFKAHGARRTGALALVFATATACQDDPATAPQELSSAAHDVAADTAPPPVRPDQQYLMDRFGVPPELLGIPDTIQTTGIPTSAVRAGPAPQGLSLAVAGNTAVATIAKPQGSYHANPMDVNESGMMVGTAQAVEAASDRFKKRRRERLRVRRFGLAFMLRSLWDARTPHIATVLMKCNCSAHAVIVYLKGQLCINYLVEPFRFRFGKHLDFRLPRCLSE